MIFYFSSQSLDFIDEDLFTQWDKAAHVTEYGLFCFLILRALRGSCPKASLSAIAGWAVLITSAYGASDEIHQIFVPHREADFFDLLADGVAALVVSAIWLFFNTKKTR